MKKVFTLLAAVMLTAVSAFATTFTFSSEADVNQSADGFTVKIDKGAGNNAPAVYSDHLRLYASNTVTVSGSGLKSVELTFSKQGSKEYATLSASTGSLVSGGTSTSNSDLKTDSWTGTASSVTFTLGDKGQRIIYQIVVNGDGSEGPSSPDQPAEPSDPDQPSGLNPDFVYPEPAVIVTPGTKVQGDAYSFIAENILVSCTKGAVTESYFSAHAGFDMTFTATRPIKGIVINGFVKKDFSATVDCGQISYLTPEEDTEANPVVVVTDVDSKSVTISCVKQLRCYSVEVYFDANPDVTVSGGSGSGGEVFLTFDSAEAIYESEFSEMWGMPNYTVFLFNEESYDYPYFALDLYPEKEGDITGTYQTDIWTLGDYTYYLWGEGDYDLAWCEGGDVTVSRSGDIYTVTGTIYCDNNTTYNISFRGTIDFYTDDEYYGDGGDTNGVKKVASPEASVDADATAYDLQGRPVGPTCRGIVIRGGRKVVVR